MLALVDLSAIFHPAWHATLSGTKAYDIVTNRLIEVTQEYDRTVVCCDHPQLLRRDWSADYKANREEKTDEFLDALHGIEARVREWGVPLVKIPGYEADDLVGTLVGQSYEPVLIVVGVHGDKDLMCLLSDTVTMQTKSAILTPAYVVKKFGLEPWQMRDWIAIAGDSTDNFEGCPGIGAGRATTILKYYGDIATAQEAARKRPQEFKRLDGIGINTMTAFQDWDPELSVRLATLITNAPVKLDSLWDEAERKAIEAQDNDPMPF